MVWNEYRVVSAKHKQRGTNLIQNENNILLYIFIITTVIEHRGNIWHIISMMHVTLVAITNITKLVPHHSIQVIATHLKTGCQLIPSAVTESTWRLYDM